MNRDEKSCSINGVAEMFRRGEIGTVEKSCFKQQTHATNSRPTQLCVSAVEKQDLFMDRLMVVSTRLRYISLISH